MLGYVTSGVALSADVLHQVMIATGIDDGGVAEHISVVSVDYSVLAEVVVVVDGASMKPWSPPAKWAAPGRPWQ